MNQFNTYFCQSVKKWIYCTGRLFICCQRLKDEKSFSLFETSKVSICRYLLQSSVYFSLCSLCLFLSSYFSSSFNSISSPPPLPFSFVIKSESTPNHLDVATTLWWQIFHSPSSSSGTKSSSSSAHSFSVSVITSNAVSNTNSNSECKDEEKVMRGYKMATEWLAGAFFPHPHTHKHAQTLS